jgi:hypothetical protein
MEFNGFTYNVPTSGVVTLDDWLKGDPRTCSKCGIAIRVQKMTGGICVSVTSEEISYTIRTEEWSERITHKTPPNLARIVRQVSSHPERKPPATTSFDLGDPIRVKRTHRRQGKNPVVRRTGPPTYTWLRNCEGLPEKVAA